MATKAKNPPKKKKNGYEMPKPLSTGDLLEDNQKQKWKIGVSIGVGGFGEIYSACKADSGIKKLDDYPYVVKIEPKENGPLFVEMHFYMRNAKIEDIDAFKKTHKLKSLGMPQFVAMGSHEIQQIKHRFIVLPRFGRDIWKIFEQLGHKYPAHTTYRITWQILQVLEYIHSRTYVHMDIKGSNILLGFGKNGDEQVNLLDFGLACHYNTKDFKPDPKKMHNGTIEYTSRDAHMGVPTMRGDIEVLGYNLIEWCGGKLPWVVKKLLTKPVDVQKAKEEFMKNPDVSLKTCFGSSSVPVPVTSFFKNLGSMKHDTAPDFNKLRSFMDLELKAMGEKNSGPLSFKAGPGGKEKSQVDSTDVKTKPGRPNFDTKKSSAVEKSKIAEKTKVPEKQDKPSKRARDPKKDDDDDDVAEVKKKPAKKTLKPPEPENTRPARNREPRRYVVSDSEDDDNDSPPMRSPKKKSRVPVQKSPASTTSKENEETNDGSTGSPPQKKSKKKDNEKTSKTDNTAKGVITLKSKSNSKGKKTVQINFNLDVSLNSDLVVVVNRKDKKTVEG